MARDIRKVVAEIDALNPADPEDLDLDRLSDLAVEYFSSRVAPKYLGVWFHLYERFPETDGYGVFWAILHGIEAQPGSDRFVVESVRRKPSRFPVTMVNRMLNGSITSVGGVDLLGLLAEVAADSRCPGSVREETVGFLEHQRRRDEGPDKG